jgi:hypothetical protein
MVGISLDIAYTSGTGKVIDVDETSITPATFNIFPDAAYTQELGDGYTYGEGTPVCNVSGPGEIAVPGTQTTFALCMGMLNGETTAGAAGATVVTIDLDVDATCVVAITENADRGGIIATDGTPLDISSQIGGQIDPEGCTYTGPDQTEWVAVGSPASWCGVSQCHGDADDAFETIGKGSFAVGYNDIDILLAGFNTAYTIGDYWIAADFDHAAETIGKGTFRVGYNDIDILLAWFNTTSVPTDCQTGSPVSP